MSTPPQISSSLSIAVASDRTGTVIAVYRMTHDAWTGEQAADEAETFGIGWWQRGMRDFINDYYRDQVVKK